MLFIEVCFTLTVGTSLIIVLLFLCRSRDVTDIPAVPKSRSSSTRKNVGIAFSVVFAVVLVVFLAIIFHKRSRRQVFSFPFNTKIMKLVYVTVLHKELKTPDPGGVLPYITYTGMCRPTGSWFWSSWFRTGYNISNARKLQFCKQPFEIIQVQIALKNTVQCVNKQTVVLFAP